MVDFDDGNQNQSSVSSIEDVYTLTYVPEGYEQTYELVTSFSIVYRWKNGNGDMLVFEQFVLDNSKFILDVQEGEQLYIKDYETTVYYRVIGSSNYYIWNDGYYSLTLESSTKLDDNILYSIFSGIIKK